MHIHKYIDSLTGGQLIRHSAEKMIGFRDNGLAGNSATNIEAERNDQFNRLLCNVQPV